MSADKLNAPWTAMAGAGLDRGSIYYVYGKQERIAVVYYPSGAHSYGEARANVIAAAPELLDALKALRLQALQSPDLRATEWGQEAIAMSNIAIAKATGQ